MSAETIRLTGRVTVRGDRLPPKGAKLIVRVVTERSKPIAEQSYAAAGLGTIRYSLPVPKDRIDPDKVYYADAEIRDRDGLPRWQTIDGGKPVLTQGNPTEADLLVIEIP